MNNQNVDGKHQEIRISDRRSITLTGVLDVSSFDENNIIVKSNFGMLAIDGTELKILNLSTETGELFVEGNVGGVVFFDEPDQGKKRGFFKR